MEDYIYFWLFHAGRYFATSPFSIAVNVIGKNVFSNPQKYSYTVSDGRYGNFTWKDQTFIFQVCLQFVAMFYVYLKKGFKRSWERN